LALDSQKIPHYAILTDINPKTRKLPSGRLLVPEITVGEQGSPKFEIVFDSERILHWLDETRGTNFYPTDAAAPLSIRASDKILGGAVLYYNWIHYESYALSMRATVDREFLPGFICFFRAEILDFALEPERVKKRPQAQAMIGADVDLNDEPAVRRILMDELTFFQSLLKMDSQEYLLEGTTEPTAVDFSVHVMVEKFVGTMGDANNLPSMPELLEEKSLARLWRWNQSMVEKHPLRFKGKGKPKD